MPNKTVLHTKHLESGAKMVDFHGWEMPINYGSQIEEHHAVRKDAGMFDVSHMTIVDVTGKDAKAYLRFLLANDVVKLQDKGKAFSYFGTIAKRYLILYNNNNYKKLKQKTGVDAVDTDQSIVIDLTNNYSPDEPMDRATEFIEYLLRYFELYIFDHFPKPEDAKTADAILELFRKRENIELFNKKAIYIYIREMTDQSTPQITKVIKKMRKIYIRLISQYNEHGYVSMKF